jgi:hypothetical protein
MGSASLPWWRRWVSQRAPRGELAKLTLAFGNTVGTTQVRNDFAEHVPEPSCSRLRPSIPSKMAEPLLIRLRADGDIGATVALSAGIFATRTLPLARIPVTRRHANPHDYGVSL